jgi:hypothetical protein
LQGKFLFLHFATSKRIYFLGLIQYKWLLHKGITNTWGVQYKWLLHKGITNTWGVQQEQQILTEVNSQAMLLTS